MMTCGRQDRQSDVNDPAEQLLLHLLHHPCDLVDARRLMRRFHASVNDVQRALQEFERLTPPQTKEAAGQAL
ncbi:MAG TPA: hypothetical protein VNN62_13885 [Methylomirabilota bacterium]|jgi:hypothetical protein|nr:hypothetical protein [Methylomirabilota bacterium]